jgi:hypothetical protein
MKLVASLLIFLFAGGAVSAADKPRRYFNMDGISYSLSGDLEAAWKIRNLAKRLMFVTKTANTHNLDQVWNTTRLDNGSLVKVRSIFGRDFAEIYVPPQIEIPVKKIETWETITPNVWPAVAITLEDHGGWLVMGGVDWEGPRWVHLDPEEDQNLFIYELMRDDKTETETQVLPLKQIGVHDILLNGPNIERVDTVYSQGTGAILKRYQGSYQEETWFHVRTAFTTISLRTFPLSPRTWPLPPENEDLEEGYRSNSAAIVRGANGYADDENYVVLYKIAKVVWNNTGFTFSGTVYVETNDDVFEIDTYYNHNDYTFTDALGGGQLSSAKDEYYCHCCNIYDFYGEPVYVFCLSRKYVGDDFISSMDGRPEYFIFGAIFKGKLVLSEWIEGDRSGADPEEDPTHYPVNIFGSLEKYGKYSRGTAIAAEVIQKVKKQGEY